MEICILINKEEDIMGNCPHTTFPRNTKVFIALKNGDNHVDYYIGKKSRFVFFRNLGKISLTDIRVISYFKNQPHQTD